MEVNELVIALRQRNHWSAIDLGVSLARHWWRPLFISWLLPASLAFGLLALIFRDSPQIAIIVLWWLKPLFERFPLYITSRRLFGEQLGATDSWRAYRQVCSPDLIPWLLWRRLNPARAFVMPVTLLERLQGKRREKRLGVLQMEASGPAMWLTVIGIHIESIFPMCFLLLVGLLMPPEMFSFSMLQGLVEQEAAVLWLFNGLTFVTMALVAPFYVTSGFMLYINRRVTLEGWDIELNFRQLAARSTALRTAIPGFLLTAVLLALGTVTEPAFAEGFYKMDPNAPVANYTLHTPISPVPVPVPVRSMQAQQSREAINTVMAREEFNQVLDRYSWRWAFDEDEEDTQGQIPDWLIKLIERLETLFPETTFDATELLAWLLRAAIVGAILLILAYIAIRYRDTIASWLRENAPPPEEATTAPDTLFGLTVRRESLPDDVPAQVQALWQDGQSRAAIALLYRATLAMLIHQHGFGFTQDLTENECAALVASHGDLTLADFFTELSVNWQELAYGHRAPDSLWVAQACEQWQGVFGDHE